MGVLRRRCVLLLDFAGFPRVRGGVAAFVGPIDGEHEVAPRRGDVVAFVAPIDGEHEVAPRRGDVASSTSSWSVW